MLITLDKNQYLSDKSALIIDVISQYRKIGLWGPMGIGKTEFFKTDLRKYAKDQDLILIMVNPSVGQIEQIGETDPTIETVCQGKGYYGGDVAVTTPESLYKVVTDIMERGKKFMLVFDEAHEKVASINFRSKFGVIDKYEKLAAKVLYMTATPGPLFDEKLDFTIQVEKYKSAIDCDILTADRVNVSTIINQIDKAILNGEKVILCHDNKAENKKIYERLVSKYGAEFLMAIEDTQDEQINLFDDPVKECMVKEKAFDLVSSQDRNGDAYKAIMRGEYPRGLKVLITTSFIKAGLNISNPENTRMILTVSAQGFSLVDKVQQMGRLRESGNIKGITLLVPRLEVEKQQTAFLPLETRAEQMREYTLDHYNTYVKDRDSVISRTALDVACATYDPQQEKYIFDENKLRNRIYLEYCWTLLVNLNRLKIDLERETAINLNVTIKDLNCEIDEELEKEIQEDKKAKRESYAAACEQIKDLSEHNQAIIINVPRDEIKLLNDDLRPIAEAYHLNMSDNERKFINQVRSELCEGDKVKAHLKVIAEPKKDIQRELDQLEVIKLNNDFNLVKDKPQQIERSIKKYKKKLAARVYFIRQQLKETEEKRGRLSNKKLNQLSQLMIDQGYYTGKKINLTKARDTLEQDLSLIYELRTDAKGSLISRIKK